MNKEILTAAGIDCDEALKRFLGDEALYTEVLTAFAQDDVARRAEAAFDSNDKKRSSGQSTRQKAQAAAQD